jgi:hypothetical protein
MHTRIYTHTRDTLGAEILETGGGIFLIVLGPQNLHQFVARIGLGLVNKMGEQREGEGARRGRKKGAGGRRHGEEEKGGAGRQTHTYTHAHRAHTER